MSFSIQYSLDPPWHGEDMVFEGLSGNLFQAVVIIFSRHWILEGWFFSSSILSPRIDQRYSTGLRSGLFYKATTSFLQKCGTLSWNSLWVLRAVWARAPYCIKINVDMYGTEFTWNMEPFLALFSLFWKCFLPVSVNSWTSWTLGQQIAPGVQNGGQWGQRSSYLPKP